jgi:hypothetical protein
VPVRLLFVTLLGHAVGLIGGLNDRRWGHGGRAFQGLGPTREVPDDHYDPVCCRGPAGAGVHQYRAAGACWLPGWLYRPGQPNWVSWRVRSGGSRTTLMSWWRVPSRRRRSAIPPRSLDIGPAARGRGLVVSKHDVAAAGRRAGPAMLTAARPGWRPQESREGAGTHHPEPGLHHRLWPAIGEALG